MLNAFIGGLKKAFERQFMKERAKEEKAKGVTMEPRQAGKKRRVRYKFKFKPLTWLMLFFILSVLYHLGLGIFGLAVNHYRLAEEKKRLEEKRQLIQELQAERDRWYQEDFLEKEAYKLGLVKKEEPAREEN